MIMSGDREPNMRPNMMTGRKLSEQPLRWAFLFQKWQRSGEMRLMAELKLRNYFQRKSESSKEYGAKQAMHNSMLHLQGIFEIITSIDSSMAQQESISHRRKVTCFLRPRFLTREKQCYGLKTREAFFRTTKIIQLQFTKDSCIPSSLFKSVYFFT